MLEGFEPGLRLLWPHAPKAKIDAILEIADEVFAEYELDTPLRVAHFMAQVTHENGAGTITRESGNYSAKRIVEVFGPGKSSAAVTPEEAETLAHNGPALFDRVYNLPRSPKLAKELGNHLPGDGYVYRGNGDLQLTGRGSHQRIGELIGVDLEDNPDQLADPKISFRVAAAEFGALKCLEACDEDNIVKVTLRVNGGRNGLAERTVWLRKWKRALENIDEPAKIPRGADGEASTKPLMKTKIAQGSVIGGAVSATVAAGQVAQTLRNVSDTSDAAKQIADNATTVVTAVKPLFGLPLSFMLSGLALAATGSFLYVLWKRYQKLRDEGV